MVDAEVQVRYDKFEQGETSFRARVQSIVDPIGRPNEPPPPPYFEYFISLIIILNTVLMCCEYTGASDHYNEVLNQLNNVCLYVFILEAVLKLIAYGPRFYFFVNWNRFDFIIVVISLVTINDRIASMLQFNMTVLRIIRVARLLRMIKASKDI